MKRMKRKEGKGKKGGYPHCYKYLSRYYISNTNAACPRWRKKLINQGYKEWAKAKDERRRSAKRNG